MEVHVKYRQLSETRDATYTDRNFSQLSHVLRLHKQRVAKDCSLRSQCVFSLCTMCARALQWLVIL